VSVCPLTNPFRTGQFRENRNSRGLRWFSGNMAGLRRSAGVLMVILAAALVSAPGAAAEPVGVPVNPGGLVVGFGDNHYGQLDAPPLPQGITYTAVAAGGTHSLALRSDGQVKGFGRNDVGQLNVPALPQGTTYIAIAAGSLHSLVLRSDGQVRGFGWNEQGQLNVPALPRGLTYTGVAAGQRHSLVLRSDGQVRGFGSNDQGQLNLPAPKPGRTYTQTAAGTHHSLALDSDGQITATPVLPSNNSAVDKGQSDVPPLPPGLAYTAVDGGRTHSLALRSDGRVVGFGDNEHGQINVPGVVCFTVDICLDLSGATYTAVAAADGHSLALRSDGQVVAFGGNFSGQTAAPPAGFLAQYAAIAAGSGNSLAILRPSPVFAQLPEPLIRLPEPTIQLPEPPESLLCDLLPQFCPCGPFELCLPPGDS
jgi:alpha-tubulin suppressor-like RCC1 family protein